MGSVGKAVTTNSLPTREEFVRDFMSDFDVWNMGTLEAMDAVSRANAMYDSIVEQETRRGSTDNTNTPRVTTFNTVSSAMDSANAGDRIDISATVKRGGMEQAVGVSVVKVLRPGGQYVYRDDSTGRIYSSFELSQLYNRRDIDSVEVHRS